MTALHGDKIESLLWENGYEFQHKQYLHLPSDLEVYDAVGGTITLGETWIEEDEWMIDGSYIGYQLYRDGELFEQGYLEETDTEEGVLAQIIALTE